VSPSESEFPEVPDTAETLTAKWARSDAAYAERRLPLDPLSVESIRMMRMQEANQLPNIKERGRMYARAKTWEPPVHPDYGSMRDWMHG
jgi:hypothetical protein